MLLPYWYKICKYFWKSMFFIPEFQFSNVVVKSPFFVYMSGNWKKQFNSLLRHENACMILMSQLTELQFPNMQNRILSTACLRFNNNFKRLWDLDSPFVFFFSLKSICEWPSFLENFCEVVKLTWPFSSSFHLY